MIITKDDLVLDKETEEKQHKHIQAILNLGNDIDDLGKFLRFILNTEVAIDVMKEGLDNNGLKVYEEMYAAYRDHVAKKQMN